MRRILLLIILSLSLSLVGCRGEESENLVEEKNEPLVINLEGGDYGYPNPYAHHSRGPGAYKMRLIFDSLIERGEDDYIPWMAQDWKILEEGYLYRFKLRENLKWHDGEDLTAEDVKFSFEYFLQHPPVSNSIGSMENTFIDSIEVVDNLTVDIRVKEQRATILASLGETRIIPKHIWENIEDPNKYLEEDSVVGSGPYLLTDYNMEQGAYRFEKFDDYWREPSIDVLQFVPVSDSILAFDRGDIDLTGISPDLMDKYLNNEEYEIIEDPGFWGYRLAFNMENREEFKNKDLRQAINYGIDKEDLIDKVARGGGELPSAGYLPRDHQWFNSNVKEYDFDLDRARELLNGEEYKFTLTTGNSNPEIRIAELIKLSLEEIGIEIEINSMDGKARDDANRNGNYEIILIGHGGWGNDPDLLRTLLVADGRGLTSTIGYNNEEINRLANKQLHELDDKNRKDIIFELQEIISEEVPVIPLYNTTGYNVYRPEKYNGWKHVFNHHSVSHNKISFVK